MQRPLTLQIIRIRFNLKLFACISRTHTHVGTWALECLSAGSFGSFARCVECQFVRMEIGANNWGNLNLCWALIKHWGIKLQKFTDWIMQRVLQQSQCDTDTSYSYLYMYVHTIYIPVNIWEEKRQIKSKQIFVPTYLSTIWTNTLGKLLPRTSVSALASFSAASSGPASRTTRATWPAAKNFSHLSLSPALSADCHSPKKLNLIN